MIVQRELSAWQNENAPLSAAMGFFDGVHLGHASVIGECMSHASAISGNGWVLTFDPHPLKVLKPALAPRMITGLRHKQRLFRELGVHGCMVLPFTQALAAMPPDQFVERVAGSAPPGSTFFVGGNWRFGKDRSGDAELFARLAGEKGCHVTIAVEAMDQDAMISSTRVRAAIESGDLDAASAMLGRPYSVEGSVVRGAARGRELGYPTANSATDSEALPPQGIYAAFAKVGDRVHDAVLSFGTRPTFEHDSEGAPVIEVHLLDHSQDLYDLEMEIFFVSRIRDERAFENTEALTAEMGRDLDAARRILVNQRKQRDSPLHSISGLLQSANHKKSVNNKNKE